MNVTSNLRPGVATVLALALCAVPFTGCQKQDAVGADPAAATAPAATAKTAGGAETPEALVDRLKKASADKNMGEVIACVDPKSRQEMSAAMYMGATMMVAFSQMGAQMGNAMMEGMSGMAEGMGGEVSDADKKKADEGMAEAKAQAAKLHDGYNEVMKKYGLPQLPKEGEPEPAELSKEEMDKLFNSLDHSAFVTDVVALMDKMPGEKQETESPIAVKDGVLENLKIEGDKATGTVGGEPLKFAKIDGRWYLEVDMMGGGMEHGEDGMEMGDETEELPGV